MSLRLSLSVQHIRPSHSLASFDPPLQSPLERPRHNAVTTRKKATAITAHRVFAQVRVFVCACVPHHPGVSAGLRKNRFFHCVCVCARHICEWTL